jgi:aldose 1-epimerase
MTRLASLLFIPLMAQAQNYSVQRTNVGGVEVVRLVDKARKVEVSVIPSFGNNAYEMKVNGKNLFWTPTTDPAEMKAKPRHLGNPFLAPWANRLDHEGYYANGKHFVLNPELKNYGRDQHKQPIHGLVLYAPWEVVEASATNGGARLVSRLEFWKRPDWMAQFPFAHTLEVTHRLVDGILEVETAIRNHSFEAMPVSVAYHPYFRLYDAPRDEWQVRLAAREQVVLNDKLTPTGDRKPVDLTQAATLKDRMFDDVYTGLIRGESGRSEFSVQGRQEKISVLFGPKYTVAVVYAPKGTNRDFICFEPMSGPTNAFNLAHAGKYNDLQTIAPGAEWRESFWIVGTGF